MSKKTKIIAPTVELKEHFEMILGLYDDVLLDHPWVDSEIIISQIPEKWVPKIIFGAAKHTYTAIWAYNTTYKALIFLGGPVYIQEFCLERKIPLLENAWEFEIDISSGPSKMIAKRFGDFVVNNPHLKDDVILVCKWQCKDPENDDDGCLSEFKWQVHIPEVDHEKLFDIGSLSCHNEKTEYFPLQSFVAWLADRPTGQITD